MKEEEKKEKPEGDAAINQLYQQVNFKPIAKDHSWGQIINVFVYDEIESSVEDYSSRMVCVVCRMTPI